MCVTFWRVKACTSLPSSMWACIWKTRIDVAGFTGAKGYPCTSGCSGTAAKSPPPNITGCWFEVRRLIFRGVLGVRHLYSYICDPRADGGLNVHTKRAVNHAVREKESKRVRRWEREGLVCVCVNTCDSTSKNILKILKEGLFEAVSL